MATATADAQSFVVSINPATGAEIARYRLQDRDEREGTLANAVRGQKDWAALPQSTRSQIISQIGANLRKNQEKLAALITAEMGKPISAARAEVEKCATLCDWYAANAAHMLADEAPDMGADGTAIVAYRPLGIVFGVMPWNFPLWQVLRAAVPIMASGNGFMLKHADNVQGCALALEDLVLASGAPAGAFAALNVTRDAIADIIGDPRIAAVTVTAGVTAGSAIAAEAGRHLKKSVLELGGSDPFIVLADADIEKAAEAAVQARFQNCGQVCIAAKRIIIERPIAALFIERFVNLVQALRVGDPRDEETDLGPMARIRLRTELHDQVSRSVDAGATLLLGGAVPDGQGSYYPPTILVDVTPKMSVYEEETFGPVAAIMIADNATDALRIANDSNYGLSGAIWSADVQAAQLLARQIDTGGIFINGVAVSDPRVPIGGVKRSGYGRELSHFGLREFCNAQLIWLRP